MPPALRTQMARCIKKANVEPWPRVFHNLRASRQTELEDDWPSHVVNRWLGNSEKVGRDHYLQITDDHFEKAARDGAEIGAVSQGNASQPEAPAEKKRAASPTKRRTNGSSASERGSLQNAAKCVHGNGWESNPPGDFSAATTDLKSAAVTRSAYTPGDRNDGTARNDAGKHPVGDFPDRRRMPSLRVTRTAHVHTIRLRSSCPDEDRRQDHGRSSFHQRRHQPIVDHDSRDRVDAWCVYGSVGGKG